MAGSRFQASRLKEARDAREIPTLTSLASLIGVDVSTVSRWEAGSVEPTPDHVTLLATHLRLRPSFFYRPPFVHGSRTAFLRSLASARKRDLNRQRARASWLQEISQIVQHYVALPPVNLPRVLEGGEYRTLRDEDLEEIASDLRRHWGLGGNAVANVVDVLERNGFVVGEDATGTGTLDGMCVWSDLDSRPYILLATDKMSFFRRQMDAAHEMAHAILHRDVTPDDLKRDFELVERQAFRLASAFLMPAETFPLRVGMPTLASFQRLKDSWRVSIKAMIRRCQDIGMLEAEEARQLYKYYSARGWTREEPLDRTTPVARPQYLGRALQMIVDGKVRSKAELVSQDFVFPGDDVAALVGLPRDWFETGEVVELRLNHDRGPMRLDASDNVVPVDFGRRVKGAASS